MTETPDNCRVRIAPSILSADFARLGEQVRAAVAGGADRIHVDVMDGHFVPNITVGPLVLRALRPVTPIPLEAHLMIEEPERHARAFAHAGADLIIVHPESTGHLYRAVQTVKELGKRVGVSLNPATPISAAEEVLPELDLVLIMTVNPGFGGQVLIPATIDKVRRLRRLVDERGLQCEIEVDGGINRETASIAVRAGARILVAGSAIFNAPDIAEATRSLLQAAEVGLS